MEGRFVREPGDDSEVVLTRVIPAAGRGRAYVDGRMVGGRRSWPSSGGRLVDLHGQHAHQSLLHPRRPAPALDVAPGITTDEVAAARRRCARI